MKYLNLISAFFKGLNKVAISDRYGSFSYQILRQKTIALIDNYKHNNLIRKRVLIVDTNSHELVCAVLALLALENEVIFQAPSSTKDENDNLIEQYRINCIIENNIIKSISNNNHSIKQEKLYFLSSGSTGQPKLFGFSFDQLLQKLENTANYLDYSDEVILCPLTISHSHGFMLTFSGLLKSCKVVFLHDHQLDLSVFENLMIEHKPSIISSVPYFYQSVFNSFDSGFEGFSNLKWAICGSAPLSIFFAKSFYRKFGFYLNQAYGLSEIGPICIDKTPEINYGSIGTVLPNIEYKLIRDNEWECMDGNVGELIVKATYMSNEYLNLKEETDKAFKDGWLYTQDILKQDADGRLFIIGRKSSFININGFKLQPQEIENFINAISIKIKCAIISVSKNGREKIIAFVENYNEIDIEQIRDFCKEGLSKYKQPSEYLIIDKLPRLSIDKIDYVQLEKMYD